MFLAETASLQHNGYLAMHFEPDFQVIHKSYYDIMSSDEYKVGEKKRDDTHEKIKQKYDETAYALPPLRIGMLVWVQDPKRRLWDKMRVVEEVRDTGRSHVVTIPGGRAYVRNRRFLRPPALECSTPEDDGKHENSNEEQRPLPRTSQK
ncbi:hypothetical protein TCAL_14102 [Tigriopus californicus]|uniref:Uncharacterized protein n=1 Tax=Tigriopus californicus TaxID=6832 RepID=A0A553P9U3_TIGCA|nr:hypothetical protein TCAL_14102 [Tigriopus californicus]|eukprot:TCALIF_14102-PA protein Name:"Protein of unknown function" AED:0.25 eAED:0.26 QI:0/-1/0/1/-1/1/1/0/148